MLNIIKKFKRINPTLLNLSHFDLYNKSINNDNMIKQSNFLKNELLVRLSHNIYNLINLPYGLPNKKNIDQNLNSHINSFEKIHSFYKIDKNNNKKFLDTINNIKNINKNLEINISKSMIELKHSELINLKKVNSKLDNIFLMNIGLKTLIEQHYNMVSYKKSIIKNCNINNIINIVCNDINCASSRLFDKDINFKILNNEDIYIKYIPYHIYYIVNEILKNSAVAHFTNNINDSINITILNGNEDIIIKISDKGKGFLRSEYDNLFTYSYSTYKEDVTDEYEILNIPIMTGFGFGLPLSRIYCRYFGGDLIIIPIENIGTEVYIYLKKEKNIYENIY